MAKSKPADAAPEIEPAAPPEPESPLENPRPPMTEVLYAVPGEQGGEAQMVRVPTAAIPLIEGLKAKLAEQTRIAEEAKARVAAAEAKVSPAAPDLSGPMRKFVVSLQYADTFVVEAPHESLAFEAYKRASGVIRSDYAPEVREATPDAKLGKVRKTFP